VKRAVSDGKPWTPADCIVGSVELHGDLLASENSRGGEAALASGGRPPSTLATRGDLPR